MFVHVGQLMPPGGPQPLPGGPPQQPGQGFKQQGMPPPGFPGLPAGMQQQQQRRHGSPAGMHPGGPHMQQQQQQQGQPGGPQLPLWAGPGPAGTPGARPPMPQQQQQQGGPGSGSGAVFGGEYLPTATTASADAMRVVSPAALVHKLRTSGSTWMAADDINYILRIQHMATHSGVPYVEDFYFQVGLGCDRVSEAWGSQWVLGGVLLAGQPAARMMLDPQQRSVSDVALAIPAVLRPGLFDGT